MCIGKGKMNPRLYHFIKHLFNWIYQILIFNGGHSDIARDAIIPHSTHFMHKAMGVTIGSGTRLGENVTIYQHVTTGNRHHPTNNKNIAPTIEDNVIIFSYACILGGITIGHDSIIGAHSLVLNDIPPNSVAIGIPAKIIHTTKQETISEKLEFRKYK